MAHCIKSCGNWSKNLFIQRTWLHNAASLHGKNGSLEFLQNSIIPTMHFQTSLPRLPIPKLEDSCQRYLMSQKPLLTPEEYEQTKQMTENFLGYEGKALHAELIELDKKMKYTSYIKGPWTDRYLKFRDSRFDNMNPFIMARDDPHTNDPLVRATKLIYSALRFKNSLDANVLEPSVYHLNANKSDTKMFRRLMRLLPSSLSWYGAYLYKAFPLDMSQYANLFNSTRIPHEGKDELRVDKSGKHMLIIRNGHIFTFDVIDETGAIFPKDVIHKHLKAIMDQSNELAEYPVPVLTDENRDTWAGIRSHLEQNPHNSKMLAKIDGALFGISLDDKVIGDELDAFRVFLHSEGHSRWFDKSFHYAIAKDSRLAINVEHAWVDGVTVARFLNDTVEDSCKDSYQPSTTDATTSVQKVDLELDDFAKQAIITAQTTFSERVAEFSMAVQKFEEFGENFLKSKKIGPDSVMQLAFQMAHYRQNGRAAATEQLCSTAAFKHGRTETLRSCTVATHACSKAFENSHPAGVEEMDKLIRDCATMHNQLIKEAAMGQGFDRHFYALQTLSEQSDRKVEFFNTDAYKNLNHNILCSSTVGYPNITMGGFAPVVSNGLGIGYKVNKEWLGCYCTSYPDSPNADEFVELVVKSLDDIGAVLEGRNFKVNV